MAKYRVIKAHDGIQVGTEKSLPESTITAYMVENGYWEEVKEEKKKKTTK